MAIGAISSYLGNAAVASIYARLSSGTRINRAADDASGLAMSQNIRKDVTSFSTKADNAYASQDSLNVSDGKLASVQKALDRISELADKASSGVLSADDKGLVQQEISQMTDEIAGIIGNHSKLFEDMGIENFDVTGNFSSSVITDAINTVSAQRSRDGALYNRFGREAQSFTNAAENLSAAQSRILDTDYGSTSTVLAIQKAVNQYSMIMQSQYANTQSSSQLQLLNMLV